MNTPPLIYRSFAFSALVHILLFVIAVIVIKQADIHKKAEPYIVSLVEDFKVTGSAPVKGSDKSPNATEAVKKQTVTPSKVISNEKSGQSAMQQENIVKERIEALQAKKKIEKIVALRKVINVDGQRNTTGGGTLKSQNKAALSGTAGPSTPGSDYYSMIIKRIRQEWVFPESLDRNLEAIISIKIAKDGSIKIERIEKSSGNQLFDRYALRAINKASPLPPPPQEMEVGVRFYP